MFKYLKNGPRLLPTLDTSRAVLPDPQGEDVTLPQGRTLIEPAEELSILNCSLPSPVLWSLDLPAVVDKIEPHTWFKLIARVNGANSGAFYIQERGNVNGYGSITKPEGHTWESFTRLLLSTMPDVTREHYEQRFQSFIKGWQGRGYDEIPDEAPKVLEDKHWAPSWRRLAKVLLRNDWWCKGLGLTQPKSDAYGRYLEIKKQKKKDALNAPLTDQTDPVTSTIAMFTDDELGGAA